MRTSWLGQDAAGAGPRRFIGAHDALTARLGQEAGFSGIWASGLEISASHGVCDDSSLGRAAFVERVAEMARVVEVPILVDVDTGFGNASEVARTVQLFEKAGAQGICIEDKMFPKRNSFSEGPQRLEPVDKFTAKLKAALLARRASNFVIVARTEALIVGAGQDEAGARVDTYLAAGADGAVVHSKKSTMTEVARVINRRGATHLLGVIPTTYPSASATELKRAGASFIIYANQGLRSQIAALRRAYADILVTGSALGIEMQLTTVKDVLALQERCREAASHRTKRASAEGAVA